MTFIQQSIVEIKFRLTRSIVKPLIVLCVLDSASSQATILDAEFYTLLRICEHATIHWCRFKVLTSSPTREIHSNRLRSPQSSHGYVCEYNFERLWRDVKLLEIDGRTNESHLKNMVRDLRKRDSCPNNDIFDDGYYKKLCNRQYHYERFLFLPAFFLADLHLTIRRLLSNTAGFLRSK